MKESLSCSDFPEGLDLEDIRYGPLINHASVTIWKQFLLKFGKKRQLAYLY